MESSVLLLLEIEDIELFYLFFSSFLFLCFSSDSSSSSSYFSYPFFSPSLYFSSSYLSSLFPSESCFFTFFLTLCFLNLLWSAITFGLASSYGSTSSLHSSYWCSPSDYFSEISLNLALYSPFFRLFSNSSMLRRLFSILSLSILKNMPIRITILWLILTPKGINNIPLKTTTPMHAIVM